MIFHSDLTGKIYTKTKGGDKIDVTDQVVTAIQILLHKGHTFNILVSKADNKRYELVLNELKGNDDTNKKED